MDAKELSSTEFNTTAKVCNHQTKNTTSKDYNNKKKELLQSIQLCQRRRVKKHRNTATINNNEAKIMSMLRSNIIGSRVEIDTPFGEREIVYADYTASGRFLKIVEEYMSNVVAPMYANTHTEASETGAQTTKLREEARDIIRHALNAPKEEYAVVFSGNGSTGAIDKLFRVFGFGIPEYADKKWKLSSNHVPQEERPVVFISHMEHHSNELIWRESIARCIVIEEDEMGLPNLAHLERELIFYKKQKVPMIGSFSAGSNVTGICTPVRSLTRLLHQYGAYACFDFAGVGAYVNIDVYRNGGQDAMDAIFLSPHKFIGGPGSSGLLVARKKLFQKPFGVKVTKPTIPGGGTVSFVAKHTQDYVEDPEVREDAGTPGISQCIRAGLVFKVKEMVGSDTVERLEATYSDWALSAWKKHPYISLMGSDRSAYFDVQNRVSIISFNVMSNVPLIKTKESRKDSRDLEEFLSNSMMRLALFDKTHQKHLMAKLSLLHHNFIIALLNDLYGIQGRGGCSCAGPYGQSLFGFTGEDGNQAMKRIQDLVDCGLEAFKPGWARLNFNYFIGNDEVDFIVEAVKQIATHGWKLLPFYTQDMKTGQYIHGQKLNQESLSCLYSLHDFKMLNEDNNLKMAYKSPRSPVGERDDSYYRAILDMASDEYTKAEKCFDESINVQNFTMSIPNNVNPSDVWWLTPSEAYKALTVLSVKQRARQPSSNARAA